MAFYIYSTLHCASYSYWGQHNSGFLPLHLLYLQRRALALNNSYFQASHVYQDRLICTACTYLCSHFVLCDIIAIIKTHHKNMWLNFLKLH